MPKRKTRSSKDDEEELPPSKLLTEPVDQADSTTRDERDDKDNTITHFTMSFNYKTIPCERHQPPHTSDRPPSLIFTHGAGGGISAPATRDFAAGFGCVSPITCFEGTLNLPNRIKAFHEVLKHSEGEGKVALGGRSMGARAAVLTALEMESMPEALVLVSWPLMAGPKGKKREPERREKILLDLPELVDVLFIVGDRDAQCELEQFQELREKMKAKSWLVEVKGADHGMGLKPKEGDRPMRLKTGVVAAEWLERRSETKRYCCLEWQQEAGEVLSGGWQDVSKT